MTNLDPDIPLVFHQSDLASWNYCPARLAYERGMVPTENGRWEKAAIAPERRQNSRLAYGSVIHHALHVLERDKDLQRAVDTFLYYWHPHHIEELGLDRVPRDGWIGKDSYSSMRKRGADTLRKYHDLLRYDDHELLALEYEFIVPLVGTPHYLAGTVDRLAVRWYRQRPTLCTDDYKSGVQKWGLRYNVQGSAYALASHQPDYWLGADVTAQRIDGSVVRYQTEGFSGQPSEHGNAHRGHDLFERFEKAPRRFTWINLHTLRFVDGGYRGPQDYERLKVAIMQLARSVDARAFPLRLDGEVCEFCPYRAVCGGVGLPDEGHADPAYTFVPPKE